VVGRQNADIANTLRLRDVVMQPFFGFLYMWSNWRYLANTTQPSVCGGDVALCQITLTTCCLVKSNCMLGLWTVVNCWPEFKTYDYVTRTENLLN